MHASVPTPPSGLKLTLSRHNDAFVAGITVSPRDLSLLGGTPFGTILLSKWGSLEEYPSFTLMAIPCSTQPEGSACVHSTLLDLLREGEGLIEREGERWARAERDMGVRGGIDCERKEERKGKEEGGVKVRAMLIGDVGGDGPSARCVWVERCCGEGVSGTGTQDCAMWLLESLAACIAGMCVQVGSSIPVVVGSARCSAMRVVGVRCVDGCDVERGVVRAGTEFVLVKSSDEANARGVSVQSEGLYQALYGGLSKEYGQVVSGGVVQALALAVADALSVPGHVSDHADTRTQSSTCANEDPHVHKQDDGSGLALKMEHLSVGSRHILTVPKGALVWGQPGVGKSSLLRALCSTARSAGLEVQMLLALDVLGRTSTEHARSLVDMCSNFHGVLVVDDMHLLLASTGEHFTLARCILSLMCTPARRVCVVMSAPDPVGLPAAAVRQCCLVEMSPPTAAERRGLVARLLGREHGHLGEGAHGCVARDLSRHARAAVLHVHHQSREREVVEGRLVERSWGDVSSNVRLLRAEQFSQARPEIPWGHVPGYASLRDRLETLVRKRYTNPEAFRKLNLSPVGGVLFTGPTGVGKTMLAHSLAASCPVSTMAVKCPELFKRYLGESEEAVRSLFRHARSVAPCIIILDELEAATMARSLDAGADQMQNVKARVLSALLNEMDGIGDRGSGVLLLGCTARPEQLDSALVRPGRFDVVIQVPLPNSNDRAEIIQHRLASAPLAAEGLDTRCAASLLGMEGLSCAEVRAVCNAAALAALGKEEGVSVGHVQAALKELVCNKFMIRC